MKYNEGMGDWRFCRSMERIGTYMKRFFMVTPQQPENGLRLQQYEAAGNSLLSYGETHFPIIPMLNGYVEPGDSISIHTVTYDSPHCARNLEVLRQEVADLATERGFSFELESIEVPFDDSVQAVMHTFQLLIQRVEDDDELYACVTYGSKPMPMMMSMALRYAYQIKTNASIECVVYGQLDHSKNPPTARIYDITALIKLDEIVRILGEQGVSEPESLIGAVLGESGWADDE